MYKRTGAGTFKIYMVAFQIIGALLLSLSSKTVAEWWCFNSNLVMEYFMNVQLILSSFRTI